MLSQLDSLKLDWSDFETAGRISRELAAALANDKKTLRVLTDNVERNVGLLSKCERHQLLHYLVLYDAPERGFRIRLHLSTDDHFDRPHDHRFSFSSYIVCGQYEHTCHRLEGVEYPEATDTKRQWMNIKNDDPTGDFNLKSVRPEVTRIEQSGDSYTLHHSVVHTTVTTPNTVSVFIRGPAEKRMSLIADRLTNKYWWRFGATDEPSSRRNDKMMALDQYREFRDRMIQLGVI